MSVWWSSKKLIQNPLNVCSSVFVFVFAVTYCWKGDLLDRHGRLIHPRIGKHSECVLNVTANLRQGSYPPIGEGIFKKLFTAFWRSASRARTTIFHMLIWANNNARRGGHPGLNQGSDFRTYCEGQSLCDWRWTRRTNQRKRGKGPWAVGEHQSAINDPVQYFRPAA